MGLETRSQLRLGRSSFAGQAHVDSLAFTFRGETRLDVPLATIRSATVGRAGALAVQHAAGDFTLLLESPETAAKWADKLLHPPSLCDKLGLKPGQRVVALGIDDADFLRAATALLQTSPSPTLTREADVILLGAETGRDLARLPALKKNLPPHGALWVISRKGRDATLKDTEILQAGRDAGLANNKSCSFSATHTATRFVIPRAQR